MSDDKTKSELQKDSSYLKEDISRYKLAKEAREEIEKKYVDLLDGIEDGYFEVDLAGNMTFFNESSCNIFGYPRRDFMGINNRDYTEPHVAREIYIHFNEIYQTGIPKKIIDYEIIKKDGSRRILSISASLIKDSTGKRTGFRGIARDITEFKQAEEKLNKSFEDLRKSLGGTIRVLMRMVEARDPYTAGHQKNVSDLARSIAMELKLPEEQVDGIRMAGLIHDLGKIQIPAEILSKPGRLTQIEFELIKSHSQIGSNILRDIEFPWPLSDIILQHHERIDGSGYPRGLKGDDILIEAKIIAIADVVEAMMTHRPYRAALGLKIALDEIEKNKGNHFDPETADICIKLFLEDNYRFVKFNGP